MRGSRVHFSEEIKNNLYVVVNVADQKNPLKHLTLNELLEKSRGEVVAWRKWEIDLWKQRMTEQGFDMEKSMYENIKTGLMKMAGLNLISAVCSLACSSSCTWA